MTSSKARLTWSVVVASATLLGPAAQADSVKISTVWARASPPHVSSAAVYATITGGATADRLLATSTPVAAEAGVHESRMVGSVMQMRPIEALVIPPGQTVALAPGGTHIMLTGLKAPLLAGQHFAITLRFEKAGSRTATVTVGKLASGAPADDMGGMAMPAP